MSFLRCVIAQLQKDTISRTAADVRTANSGRFGSDADVPPHLYKCLLEILTGKDTNNGGDPDFLSTHIVSYGAGLTEQDSGIELSYAEADSVYATDGPQEDTPGARTAFMSILCRIVGPADPDTQFGLVATLNARIQYYLDSTLVAYYMAGGARTDAFVPSSGVDPSIDSDRGIVCRYIKDLNEPNESEIETLWRCEYVVVFAR